MRSFVKSLTLASALGVGVPVAASAAVTEVFNWSGCGGQSFASCATVVASYDDVLKTLTFDVTNDATAGWPGRFTAVGFSGLGGTLAATGHTAPTGWTYFTGDAQGLDGPADLIWFGFNKPNPPGIGAGTTGSFSVLFTVSPPSFANFTFGLREQGFADEGPESAYGACGGSNRLHVNKDGTTYTETITRTGGAECYPDDPPTEIVPEPATMVLLATGLIGLAGAQVRRRKNNKV